MPKHTSPVTRRRFLGTAAAAAGVLAVGAACSSDDGDRPGAPTTGQDANADPTNDAAATTSSTAFTGGVIADRRRADARDDLRLDHAKCSRMASAGPATPPTSGRRRGSPTTSADSGSRRVRLEPITVNRWEPKKWSLEATTSGGETRSIDCFPVPFSAPVDALDVELAAYDPDAKAAVAGKASLYDVELITIPADLLATAGSAPKDPTGRIIDPEGTLKDTGHTVPFGTDFQEVMQPSIDAGATAFIGSLKDYPGDSYKYFVPYDGKERPIPGVWTSGTDGAWLHDQLAAGGVRIRLSRRVDESTR